MTDRIIAERVGLEDLNPREALNGFLQTPFWARQKQAFAWKPEAVRWKKGTESGTLLILIRNIKLGLSLAYVPGAPLISAGDKENFLVELSRELQGILPLACCFIRYDLPDYSLADEQAPSYEGALKKAALDIQPPDTVVISLQDDMDSILAFMHKKTRYNIRLAEKKGVKVEVCGKERLAEWYDLYRTTAERDRIGIHSFRYYEHLFQLMEDEPQDLKLYLASHDDDLLAGIIVLFNGAEAVYLYGASSNVKRNLMPAYALQFRAMNDAKNRGCLEYDMYGCPPSADPEHPMAGLYRFKTGFGGEIRHRSGAWDYPYSKLFYLILMTVERLRRYYYKVWKKK